MAIDRKKLKEQMMQRSQESYSTKDKGGKFGSFFKATPGIDFWKCGEGEHVIDILPWYVGAQYPNIDEYQHVKQGDWAYILDVWIHRKIGINENSYICPLKNYGERCPVCEDIVAMAKSDVPDDEQIGDISAKRRSIYYIMCYDSDGEEAKGVQIWEVAHVYMQAVIADRAKLPRGGGTVLFALPDEEGKQIFFRRAGMGMSSTKYTSHQFMDRDYIIPDEVWSGLTPLDELINKVGFEELYEAHYGKPYEETTTRVRSAPVKEPAKEPVVESETKPPLRRRVPLKKTTEEEPVKPVTRRTRPAPAVKKEEPAPTAGGECPGGGVFGKDIDTLAHCDQGPCDKWDDCAVEAQKLEESS